MKKRNLIFTYGRTGSSTLYKILNLHHDITCCKEPFNPLIRKSKGLKQITTSIQLHTELDSLYGHFGYTFIKHVWSPDGWPFPSGSSLNDDLVQSVDKVIFLSRKNILRRIISWYISEQTNIWAFMNKSDKLEFNSFQFDPISAESIAYDLAGEIDSLNERRNYMIKNDIDYTELFYEDLYSETTIKEISECEKIENLQRIITFCGYRPLNDKEINSANALLNISNKMVTEEIYLKIPNIKEIDQQFGNEVTGRLFD